MNAVEASTVVHAPRDEIYDFLVDFTGYGEYSEYVRDVSKTGDGGSGTEYAVTVSWWELSYTANSEVTATDPPDRIDWRLVGGIDASGHWRIEDLAESDRGEAERGVSEPEGLEPGEPAAAVDAATAENAAAEDASAHRVVLRIEYDPDSVSSSSLSLPAFVPVDVVVDRVAPHVQSEAESIVADVVADLEGERREVTLTVHEHPEND